MSDSSAEDETKVTPEERPRRRRPSAKRSSSRRNNKPSREVEDQHEQEFDDGDDSVDETSDDDSSDDGFDTSDDEAQDSDEDGDDSDDEDEDDSDSDDEDDGDDSDGDDSDDSEDDGDDETSSSSSSEEDRKEVQRLDFRSLGQISLDKIRTLAKAHDFEISPAWEQKQLVFEFYKFFVEKMSRGLTLSQGVLEILPEGYGFLRVNAAELDDADVYVSQSQVRRYGLRTGDEVVGQVRPPKDSESYYALIKVEEINQENPEVFQGQRPIFEKLVPLYPTQKIRMERKDPKILDVRLLDMITPIGKGQRGLIVAPPKAGKTTLLQSIANSITENHPDIELIVLLIDERPEEVTDMERNVKGEVIASCFDQPVANHIRVTEMVLERAKRKVELGRDVVILMDSITRLARAYNISVPSSGQTLSGGVNPHALYKPKRFFGSARNIENGGSLTILATALIDTGNKMDDFIYEEFKGTGNMELILDRELFHRRLFPSVNIKLSATRKEEMLVSNEVLQRVWVLRRVLATMKPEEALEMMLKHLARTSSNFEFLANLNKADLS